MCKITTVADLKFVSDFWQVYSISIVNFQVEELFSNDSDTWETGD